MNRDPRDARIAELERDNAQLKLDNAELLARVAELEAKVAALLEKVNRNSSNSSKSPSSDGPAQAPKRKRSKSGRKRGGQPGHKGHQRKLVPIEQVQHLEIIEPRQCNCGGEVTVDSEDVERRQVVHIPPVVPEVHEYQLLGGACERCGMHVRAQLPDGVPTGAFGPSVIAMIATLIGAYRLSKRQVVQVMQTIFGVTVSLGSVVRCQVQASEAVLEPVAEAHAYVQRQAVKHADETSWRQQGVGAWLWMAVAGRVAIFMLNAHRTKEAAKQLLGDIAQGVLCTDRYAAYGFWPEKQRQMCWSHLVRDFRAISERAGPSESIGKGLLEQSELLFKYWHRVRDGTWSRSTFKAHMRTVRDRTLDLLIEGQRVKSKTGGTCARLIEQFDSLWTFVRIEGVEPTNNEGERTVRHAVVYRKTSYGTDSEAGSRFVERMLTVHASLSRQGRDVLAFVTQACEARLHHTHPPSLLPRE